MLVKTYGSAQKGMEAITVTLEVSVGPGSKLSMLGGASQAVLESPERIRSGIKESGWHFPQQSVVINMAPATVPKLGAAYDLPLAVGILAASGQIASDRLAKYLIMGELSLDGGMVQPIPGALSMTMQARKEGYEGVILPQASAREAAVVQGINVLQATSLRQVCLFLDGKGELEKVSEDADQLLSEASQIDKNADFFYVKGQETAKRAMEVAAAGGHNILMVGPPGTGKSMMARCLASILPPLTLEEAIETTRIYSTAGKIDANAGLKTHRPYREISSKSSYTAVYGGDRLSLPGEVSFAHNGVLYLDELPEFPREILEGFRQILEDRQALVNKGQKGNVYPASFIFCASMNPCPCGYYTDPERTCTCKPSDVKKYVSRISGPLLQRIDLQVEVNRISVDDMAAPPSGEHSIDIRQRVIAARNMQRARFANFPGVHCNAQMTPQIINELIHLKPDTKAVLTEATTANNESTRTYDRNIKVARTIADLSGSPEIEPEHMQEAIEYHMLDQNWGR